MKNEHGQVILILILVMTVALAIGISVIQRSLSDISTSSKVEQSSRAFSAAEAGIEKAIQGDTAITTTDLGNSSTIQDVQKNNVPDPSAAPNQAIEYPPIAKEELAQVWLANPDDLSQFYNQSSINIYWGLANITTDKPAIEITVIYKDASNVYQLKKFLLDSDQSRTNPPNPNGFTDASGSCYPTSNPLPIDTSLGTQRPFLCKTTISGLLPKLMLLRARILYSNLSQPFAVQPNCVGACPLPLQGRLFTSTGISGQTQRKVQVFRLDKVVPPYFDYAIFSAGTISK